MNYGIPYMGSKSSICKNICRIFPKADNFYDLFGGGFSVTHYMIKHRSGHYKEFHFNEIRNGINDLIKDAIAGKYNYNVFQPKWISREEFFERKEEDAYIKFIWSFGNNSRNYLFSKEIENYKRSVHNAIVFNEFDNLAAQSLGVRSFNDKTSILERRLFLSNRVVLINKSMKIGDYQQLQQPQQLQQLKQPQQLQQLEQLERLQQLERLEQLEQLERLRFYNTSYEDVPIKPNSIIYCDIPYDKTGTYDNNNSFNRSKFLDWASSQSESIFISEYDISDNRFREIYSIDKLSRFTPDKLKIKKEKIYVNSAALKLLKK